MKKGFLSDETKCKPAGAARSPPAAHATKPPPTTKADPELQAVRQELADLRTAFAELQREFTDLRSRLDTMQGSQSSAVPTAVQGSQNNAAAVAAAASTASVQEEEADSEEDLDLQIELTPSEEARERERWNGDPVICGIISGMGDANGLLPDGSNAFHWAILEVNQFRDPSSVWSNGGILEAFMDPMCCADINQRDAMQRTPLIHAVAIGQPKIVLCLLRGWPDVNAQDNQGRTALHWAASLGSTAIVRTLSSEYSINIDARDHKSRTPLFLATLNNQPDSVALLAAKGASLDASTLDGVTPLMAAVELGFEACVGELLNLGTNVVRPAPTRTPFDVASERGQVSICRALIHAMGSIGCVPSRKSIDAFGRYFDAPGNVQVNGVWSRGRASLTSEEKALAQNEMAEMKREINWNRRWPLLKTLIGHKILFLPSKPARIPQPAVTHILRDTPAKNRCYLNQAVFGNDLVFSHVLSFL